MPRSKTQTAPEILKLLTCINFHSTTAIDVQIKNLIIFAIKSSKLKAGDQLPAVPEIHQILKVNPSIISKAYRELSVIGVLSSRQGVGVHVTPKAPALCSARCQKILVKNIYEVMQEAKALGMDESIIKNIVNECLKMESQPYTEAPAELMKIGKRK